MTPCQKLLKQEGTARRIESMQQSSATPSLHLWFLGVAEDCCMLSILLAVPSCFNSFWHGVIPTSFLMIFTLIYYIPPNGNYDAYCVAHFVDACSHWKYLVSKFPLCIRLCLLTNYNHLGILLCPSGKCFGEGMCLDSFLLSRKHKTCLHVLCVNLGEWCL